MSQRPPKKNRTTKKTSRAKATSPSTSSQPTAARDTTAGSKTSTAGTAAPSSQRREARREAAIRNEQRKKQQQLIIGGVVAAVIIAAVLILVNRPSNEAADIDYDGIAMAPPPITASAATPAASDDGSTPSYQGATIGDPNAPVTFVVYADYQCHFCEQFQADTYPQIVDDFVRDGQVKVEFREFPALGEGAVTDEGNESAQAAEAAMCAGEQDSYVEYHDKLYANYGGVNQGAFSNSRLKQFASDLGLDTDQFNDCLDSGRYEPYVVQSLEEGRTNGITATPMFIIDNGNGDPNVVQQTSQGYDLLRRQIQTSIDTAQ
jgi:protein-disulfide isomerase